MPLHRWRWAGWNRLKHHSGTVALLVWAVSVWGFGRALDGYSQIFHPLGLLGGHGIPRALGFNLLGFVLPGVCAALAISTLRTRLPARASLSMRIGVQLLVLSAIAFAAQGVVSLDPADLDAAASRYHAVAWTLWWIAFVSGALLLAWSTLRDQGWRKQRWLSLIAVLIVLTFAVFAPGAIPSGIAERIAFATWFGWLVLVTRMSTSSAATP